MGTTITKEKLDKIKFDYSQKFHGTIKKNSSKKESFHSHYNNKYLKTENLSTIYKKFYSLQHEEEDKINTLSNLRISLVTFKSEEKKNTKNEISLEQENEELNTIIFGRHKSFEKLSSSYNNINNINSNDKNIKNDNNICDDANSTTICTSTENYSHDTYSKKLVFYNSASVSFANNSDYVDIGQNAYFEKYRLISKMKNYYGNEKIIRMSYYNKLISKKIWNPTKKEKNVNTIFIFDWDDTLMCTSYVMPIISTNKEKNNKYIQENLSNLDNTVVKFLSKAIDNGLTFLITNAATGWVEYSSKNFLPNTAKILEKIKIISARGMYEKQFPGDLKQWKKKAFIHAIEESNVDKNKVTNIIAVGDSIIDLEAIYTLKNYFSNAYIKTIKFKENPHPMELEKQIWLITTQMDSIISGVKNQSIKVAKKKKEK